MKKLVIGVIVSALIISAVSTGAVYAKNIQNWIQLIL